MAKARVKDKTLKGFAEINHDAAIPAIIGNNHFALRIMSSCFDSG
ncbi:hypothetical protein [Acidicapsa acidisoli]|nr:hypothetical protein [Acidicapsa acidisoli]